MPTKRQKPQIPSLGPNLGKLGFTDLKMDDEPKQETDAPPMAIEKETNLITAAQSNALTA